MVATRAFPGWGFGVPPEKVTGIQRLAGPHHGQGEAVIVSTTATTGVAGRYASALFELADNAKALNSVAQDLDTFRKMLAESADLRRLIASPVINRELQGKALLAVLDAAGITGLTRNFIGTVAANGRARELPAMAAGYLAELARRRGETTATVTSAVPLTPPSCSSSPTRCAPYSAAQRFPSTRASIPTFSAVSS